MQERVLVTEVAKVYQLWNEVAAAMNAGDMERWLALWLDDGTQMPPDAPRRVGKVEIQRGMRSRFELFDTHGLTMNTEEVRILGDLAYAHGTYEFELVPKRGGQAKRYCGSFLDILEKQIDGSWKIAIDCHNYAVPLE
jgi:uncharacterized protein (TIGR02246 family)